VLKPLTALRFFAALLVFACHVPLTFAVAGRHHTGEAGVEFFFVLSGFILVYAHRELLRERVNLAQVKNFMVARFARIYPVQVLTLGIAMYMVVRASGVGWFASDAQGNVLALLSQLTLTQSWVRIDSPVNFNIVAWSLSDEAFFYAVFPLLATALFALVRRTRLWSLAVLAIALWGVGVFFAMVIRDSWFFYTFPPIRLLDFAIGVSLGIAFVTLGQRSRFGFGTGTALELAALAGIATAIYVTPSLPGLLGYAFGLIPLWSFAIYVFAHESGLLSKLLSISPFVYLGEISYSFYMLHVLILTVVFTHAWRFPVVVSLVSLVLCVAVSAIVFERYEKPLRKRIRVLFTGTPRTVAAIA
jgi:peptidoglycan/LPS O-acetylase OafA/YrhL